VWCPPTICNTVYVPAERAIAPFTLVPSPHRRPAEQRRNRQRVQQRRSRTPGAVFPSCPRVRGPTGLLRGRPQLAKAHSVRLRDSSSRFGHLKCARRRSGGGGAGDSGCADAGVAAVPGHWSGFGYFRWGFAEPSQAAPAQVQQERAARRPQSFRGRLMPVREPVRRPVWRCGLSLDGRGGPARDGRIGTRDFLLSGANWVEPACARVAARSTAIRFE